MKPRPLQDRTVQAIINEAEKLGAYAAPVFNRKGQVEEVHLFRDGELRASVYRPAADRIWVWRPGKQGGAAVADIPAAVQRGLDLPQKQKSEARKTAGFEPLRSRHTASSEGAAPTIPPP
jgi:hypothetical protein